MKELFIVATPIGNLEDITIRALRILKEVDLILCEDTRVTKKLLSHYDINTPLRRLDAHVEHSSINRTIALFKKYKSIALVSDSGTPTIRDPGNFLVCAARENDIVITVIPGPSALTSALSISGLPVSEFLFLGFLPHKKGRETLFKEIANSKRVIVFYESPHRIMKTLESLKKHLDGNSSIHRTIVIARELTKIHEEVVSGSSVEVLEYFSEHKDKQKGEFVVIVDSA